MTDEERKKKTEQEEKMRCAEFILQMIVKYGAEVKAKRTEKTSKDA